MPRFNVGGLLKHFQHVLRQLVCRHNVLPIPDISFQFRETENENVLDCVTFESYNRKPCVKLVSGVCLIKAHISISAGSQCVTGVGTIMFCDYIEYHHA